jgi:hypothetical protein
MLGLPIFGKKKLLMAFEYGVVISDVAKERGMKLDTEVIKRLEDIIAKEFSKKSYTQVALEMIPNILASFETK